MLRHTQNIKNKYEEIQKDLFYMIPEKWEKLYLYASIIDRFGKLQTGELFFYYIPKGIIKRNPVNVYEIPAKFNVDEEEYLKLVDSLYNTIKDLRIEFLESGQKMWSNVTISIENFRFKVEYNYDNLQKSDYSSYERHIIWRYKYLNVGIEECTKKDKLILKKYFDDDQKQETTTEIYEEGMYSKNLKNIIGFNTTDSEKIENINNMEKEEINSKNQILNFKK